MLMLLLFLLYKFQSEHTNAAESVLVTKDETSQANQKPKSYLSFMTSTQSSFILSDKN